MNLLIFGPQGSGKGTQADILAEKLNLVHIETGQIFRDMSLEDSELGKKIRDFNEKKELVPDEITLDILKLHIEKIPENKGVIIDSAPRTEGQIEGVENMLSLMGRNIDKAIYIELPYEESINRITKRFACLECKKHFILGKEIESEKESCPACGGKIAQRIDDTMDGIKKRLNTFYETTIPVVEYYKRKEMLIEVNGKKSIQDVNLEIIKKLESK